MKKILFVAIFGLIGFVSTAQKDVLTPLQLDFGSYGLTEKSNQNDFLTVQDVIIKDLQNAYLKAGGNLDRIIAVITITACNQTVTLTFNDSFTWREVLLICYQTSIHFCDPDCPPIK